MIRFAEQNDLAAVQSLWETCFPDEGGFNPYFFSHFFSLSHTLLYEADGALCAMTQMLPYQLRLPTGQAAATYIYGACTDPTHRRKGYMEKLLAHSFALDRAAGRAASMLIPAEAWLFGFYEKYGYRPFFHLDRRVLRQSETPAEQPRRLTADDLPHLAACYEAISSPCLVVRDTVYWQAQLSMFDAIGCGAYGWWEGERLAAYAFCWQDSAQEAVGLTPAREQGLLRALGRETLSCAAPGETSALGCIKWHDQPLAARGYMNLMLN